MAFQPFSLRAGARRVSDDERRLTGDFEVPRDSVIAPDPGSYFRSSHKTTAKPQSETAADHSGTSRSRPSTGEQITHGRGSGTYTPSRSVAHVKRPAVPPKDPSLSSIRLEAFASVGRREFPTVYGEMTAKSTYTIAPKTYRNHSGLTSGVSMLQVGILSDASTTLTVWARSDGENINYYSGREPSDVVVQIQPVLASQIRYAKPFDELLSSERAIQALIHFLFLNFGIIDKLSARNDVILHFKEACQILEAHQLEAKEAMRDKIEVKDNIVGQQAPAIVQNIHEEEVKRMQSAGEQQDRVIQSKYNRVRVSGGAAEHSHSQNIMSASTPHARNDSVSDLTPRARSQSRVPSLFDQIKAFEDQLREELAADKSTLEEEVQTLKMQLEAQKEKSNNAKFRLDDERETREAAQESLKQAQEKMREQEENRIRLEEERNAHAARSQEWQNKYTGLKRKLKGLAEDEDEPAEKVARH